MKKLLLIVLVLLVSAISAVPSVAAPKPVRLGTDPAGDGPPALDLTFLDVMRAGDALEIRIGIDSMLPVIGGYPDAPGIEWIFSAGKRSFIAEGVASVPDPAFYFFELKGDGYEQLEGVTGTYDPDEGFIRILVPLKMIGAKKGTLITGVHEPIDFLGKGEGLDVDAHVHHATTTYTDYLTTTESFIVP
ncbi:MAG TPA: hypothetical protein VNC78_01600 [Actinomycetota bacterium]|nr:hypothetical protein [Actinomycetota bacterium]